MGKPPYLPLLHRRESATQQKSKHSSEALYYTDTEVRAFSGHRWSLCYNILVVVPRCTRQTRVAQSTDPVVQYSSSNGQTASFIGLRALSGRLSHRGSRRASRSRGTPRRLRSIDPTSELIDPTNDGRPPLAARRLLLWLLLP